MPDPVAVTTWAAALEEFAAVLDRNEQRLEEERWEAYETPTAVTQVPVGDPTAADRARGATLLARAQRQEQRLRAELDATSAALEQLARRRRAARRYTA